MMYGTGHQHGTVPRAEVLPALKELISRCGSPYQVMRRHGICDQTLRLIVRGQSASVRRSTAYQITSALDRQRRLDEELRPVRKPRTSGYVLTEMLAPRAKELILRCGSAGRVEKLHGIARATVLTVAGHETPRVQYRTAQRILLALSAQRKLDRREGASQRFLAARREHAKMEGQLEARYGL